jgi:hypothetical protein
MSRQESVIRVLEETITGALADSRFQSILEGRTRKSNLRTFFRHFIVPTSILCRFCPFSTR